MKKPTIKEVAKEAQVSIATVSYVLSGRTNYTEATRKRVWDAASRLDYIPSKQARGLRQGSAAGKRARTNMIMRITCLGRAEVLGDRMDADLGQLFDVLANRKGFYTTTYRYHKSIGFQCPLLLDELIDGVIMGSPHVDAIQAVAAKLPVVLVDAGLYSGYGNIPVVNVDVQTAAVELLAGAGKCHSSAVLVTPPPEYLANPHGEMLKLAADREGMRVKDWIFTMGEGEHDSVMRKVADGLCAEIRKKKIDLILSRDTPYADSLYELLLERGISIPGDVSLATVDSTLLCKNDIARISYDWSSLFNAALEVLEHLINGETASCRQYLVPALIHAGKTLKK